MKLFTVRVSCLEKEANESAFCHLASRHRQTKKKSWNKIDRWEKKTQPLGKACKKQKQQQLKQTDHDYWINSNINSL